MGNEGAAEFSPRSGGPPPGRAKPRVSRPSPKGEGKHIAALRPLPSDDHFG